MHTQPTAIDLTSPVVQRALRIRAMISVTDSAIISDQELEGRQKEAVSYEQTRGQRLSWNKLDIASTEGDGLPHSCAR